MHPFPHLYTVTAQCAPSGNVTLASAGLAALPSILALESMLFRMIGLGFALVAVVITILVLEQTGLTDWNAKARDGRVDLGRMQGRTPACGVEPHEVIVRADRDGV